MNWKNGLIALALSAAVGSGSAAADTIFEVEHARANARAGGPISEQDAYMLELYGATSGTPGYSRYDGYGRPLRYRKRWNRVEREHRWWK